MGFWLNGPVYLVEVKATPAVSAKPALTLHQAFWLGMIAGACAISLPWMSWVWALVKYGC